MAALALAFDILAKDRASKTFDTIGDSAEKAGKKGHKFGALAGAGLAVAAAAVGKFAKSSIDAYKESEVASAQLDEALRKFPKTADVSRDAFDKLNASLARKTKFDDDATASGQAVLAQFQLTGKQITDLTPLLQDYAARTGKTLPDAAAVLGKATDGQGKALKDIGIKFKDAGSKSANFEQLMGGLRSQVGGFAEKEGKTAAGQAQILSNQFGEVQETVGAKLVPVLTKLTEKLLSVVDFTQKYSGILVPLGGVILGLVAGIKTYTVVTTIATTVQKLLNREMQLNPIGLVVTALALLAAGLVYAYKKSETFREVVQGAFKVVGKFVLGAVDSILWGFEKFAQAMSHVPFVGDKFKGVAEGIHGVRDQIGKMKSDLAQLGQKTVKVPVVLDVRAGGAFGKAATAAVASKLDRLSGPRGRARGGPVSAGQPYIVGEREPEWFVPDVSGRIVNQQQAASALAGAGSRAAFHVENLHVTQHQGEDQAAAISRELTKRAFLMGFV